jgi:hypothetical protein
LKLPSSSYALSLFSTGFLKGFPGIQNTMAQNAQQLLDIIKEKFLILAGEPDEHTKQVTWTALVK